VSTVFRALSICAPIALCDAPAALAQTSAPSTLTIDIPAQPLAQALTEFAHQTGLQLVYVSGVVGNQRSRAVSAGLGGDAALAQLLQGTGLRFEHLTATSVRILAATPTAQPAVTTPVGKESFEVIISAERREEKLQDVPITIQTITGEQLKQLSVTTFNDLLQYTPNVTYSGNGPGTGNIFIRGLGFVGAGNQSQATTAPFPNVALYLDDQSMQFPARNNDVYLVDMDRVEILEGPQGTLFGGGAQAGAVRYITNKPKLDAMSGEVIAAYGITDGGDPNTALSAVLNLPLGSSFSLRAVIFSDRRGGYIDNVSSTISYAPGTPPHDLGGNPTANNSQLVANNTNPVDYQGFRVSALWKVSDSWDLLLQQNYQNMEADGYFYAYPMDPNGNALEKYQIAAFTPAYTKDRYSSTAWTLNGKLGDIAKLVYTGSYRVRHIEGQQDYSNYLRSLTGSYYACIGTGAGYFNPTYFPRPYPGLAGKPLQCSTAIGDWHDTVRNTHQSHELRISTNNDFRLRGLLGALWEKFVIYDDMNFNYLRIPQCDPANLAAASGGGPSCVSAVGPMPGSFANDPTLRENANTAFGEDDQRGYKQTAFFAAVEFDIIPKVLTLSGGTRYYKYDEFEYGSEYYTESTTAGLVVNHANGACTAAGLCGFPINLQKSESGFSSSANLTWHIASDIMTYYTFSHGFRPGGFNRTISVPGEPPLPGRTAPYCGAASTDSRCLPGGSLFNLPTFQAWRPVGYDSDELLNNELGFKSELLNHRVLMNVSAYRMTWSGVQSLLFDPEHLGNAFWMANGPSYTIKGVELQLSARVSEGLTLQGSSAWNKSSQSTSPCLISAGITPSTPYNPTPAGQCVTVVAGLPYTTPWGAPGTSSPYAPPRMFNVRARYEWSFDTFKPFVMLSVSHIASMTNTPAKFPDGDQSGPSPPTTDLLRYTIPAYTTYDAAIGVVKDNWAAQISCTNLLNAYAATNVSSAQFIKAATPLRPRVLMAQLAFTF